MLGLIGAAVGASLWGLLLGLSLVAVGVVIAGSVRKNSGILRYRFGDIPNSQDGGNPLADPNAVPGFPGGIPPATVAIVNFLAAIADAQEDQDDQFFGPTPGYPAIGPVPNTLFAAAAPIPQRNTEMLLERVHSATGVAVPLADGTSGAQPGRIPQGAKCYAWFQVSGQLGQPFVPWVQTDLRQNRQFVAGVELTTGPLFLSFGRVAVQNNGDGPLAGTLFVRLEFTPDEIPGNNFSQNNVAFLPI